MHWFIDTLAGGVTYDLFRYVVGPLVVSLLGTAVLKYSFDKLREKRQAITFGVGSFLVCIILFFFLGTRPQQPELHGRIEQVLTGPIPGSNRDTVAVIAVDIFNSGTMQSIVKGWKVQAEVDGDIYNGMFIQMPSTFTFGNIPHTSLSQPTAITFHAEDNLVLKALKPIEVGGIETGTLFVEFSNVDESVFRRGMTFTVSYEDALSHPYSLSVKSTGQIGQIAAIAGLHSELACPVPTDITGSVQKPPLATPIPLQPH